MAHDGDPSFEIAAELWRWTPEPPAKASWYFVTITGAAADAIRALGFERRALGGSVGPAMPPAWPKQRGGAVYPALGFGSVRLRAAVEGVAFETSAFPHASSGGYVLPVKAAVRKAAGVSEGDRVALGLWV